jgi:hypothetical protein
MSDVIACETITEHGTPNWTPREGRTHGNCEFRGELGKDWPKVGHDVECLAPVPESATADTFMVYENDDASDCPCWKPREEE